MITRVEITLGLLSMLGVFIVTALVGIGEFGDDGRMALMAVGYDQRSVESGAQMFQQYCADCHGFNSGGANCPPLDETSGLHGGDLGEGVAWRLEEVSWEKNDPYGYVQSIIAAGRTVSSRPDRYFGLDGPDASSMQMPAWSEHYGGPLRDDQVKDLANYVVNFRSYLPASSVPDAYLIACEENVLEYIRPSKASYLSKCYESLCRAEMKAKAGENAKDPDMLLAESKAPAAKDDKYEKIEEGGLAITEAAQAILKVDSEAYWKRFWARCGALGGTLPPEPEPEAAVEVDDAASEDEDKEASEDEAADGDEAASDEDAEASDADDTAADDEAADDDSASEDDEG